MLFGRAGLHAQPERFHEVDEVVGLAHALQLKMQGTQSGELP